MIDGLGRTIEYLRISVTDRCDLRCVYCMPECGVPALSHDDILRYEEIERIVTAMARLGVKHLRVTGGEPMTRRGCLDLIAGLRAIPGIESVAMTSNGTLLRGRIDEAKAAGLSSLNISLDTLQPDIYKKITRGGKLDEVLETLEEALRSELPLKLNVVPLRGWNESELVSLARLAQDRPLCVRFIELMPLGCARELEPVPQDELLAMLEEAFGPLHPDGTPRGHGPARYWKPAGFVGSLGMISALSHEFCGDCNRVRLTADGQLKLCLNHVAELDLRGLLRCGADDRELEKAICAAIAGKPARHGFLNEIGDREERSMNEIGG